MIAFPQGKIIYSAGQKVDTFYIIRKGCVRVSFPGGSYTLRSGDVIGIWEIGNGITSMEYQVEEDMEALNYPFGAAQMKRLFDSSVEVMKCFMSSCFRQFNEILVQYRAFREEGVGLEKSLHDNFETYCSLCEKYGIKPWGTAYASNPELSAVKEDIPLWVKGYYGTFERITASWEYQKTDFDFLYGFFAKISTDVRGILLLSQKLFGHQKAICKYLMNEDGECLLNALFALYERIMDSGSGGSDDILFVRGSMDDMLQQFEKRGGDIKLQKERIVKRILEIESGVRSEKAPEEIPVEDADLEDALAMEEEAAGEPADEGAAGQAPEKVSAAQPQNQEMPEIPAEELMKEPEEDLGNSLDVILEFAGSGEELRESFKAHVEKYKKMPNKGGTEDDVRILRQELTKEFNQIYCDAFLSSVEKEVPKVVRMFFAFGYVDEELAGKQNAVWLYNMVDRLPTDPDQGVYTIYQWLKEVYAQRKEPSRNEFDTDYVGYLLEQKRMGNITAEEQKELLTDSVAKVKFELENLFPVVNKITYGRLSTFCPLYSAHNVMKPMESMLVSAGKISQILQGIREKDYGAYYRESMYANVEAGIPKEVIHVEVLPAFILMPNVGNRGVMWQEIEGKRRSTPSRMLFSIFQLEDLEAILIRLTGEFRWEMCKRIQGARWNDLSEKSLTSEYFDYIQFYKKNSELSTDAKEKIKTDLGRTKNNFQEMFLRDYLLWIMFESNSSPRLNKVARGIFFTYCTFTSPVRQKLRANPLYQDLVDRGEIKMKQKRHKMENICQKLRTQGKEIPEEIQKEMDFMNM